MFLNILKEMKRNSGEKIIFMLDSSKRFCHL